MFAPIPVTEVLSIGVQLCGAVESAHRGALEAGGFVVSEKVKLSVEVEAVAVAVAVETGVAA